MQVYGSESEIQYPINLGLQNRTSLNLIVMFNFPVA